jgi:hypothetical protein
MPPERGIERRRCMERCDITKADGAVRETGDAMQVDELATNRATCRE